MKLTTYLKKHKVTHATLAAQLGVTEGLISQWVCGRTKITAERAVAIEKATAGHVRRVDLRPDVFAR